MAEIISQDEAMRLVTELRETVAKSSANDSLTQSKIEKIEKALDEQEKESQKLTLQIAEKGKKEIEQETAIKQLERIVTMSSNAANSKTANETIIKSMEGLNFYAKTGKFNQDYSDKKYYRTDNDIDGGYLVAPDYVQEIIKKITEIDPIRQIASTRLTSSNRLEIPNRKSLIQAYWVAEGTQDTESNSTYGMNMIKLHKMQVDAPITVEELNMAAFDMVAEINADVIEARAQLEGQAFVKGLGVASPVGFMACPTVPFIKSGAAADINSKNLIQLSKELKTGYAPMFGFNRRTLGSLREEVGTDGQYRIWLAGNLVAGVPNTIAGDPYVLIPSMDDIGAGKFPVILGDFARGYLIGDHTFMSVLRDDYTLSRFGKVRFCFSYFVGGDVIQPESFIKLKCEI